MIKVTKTFCFLKMERNAMRKVLLAILMLFAMQAHATQTWIVVGDSIMSFTADGTAAQHSLNLVMTERDIMFKNIASGGASLGGANQYSYDHPELNDWLTVLSGWFTNFDGIIIQAGTNDWSGNVPWQNVWQSTERIILFAQGKGKKVMILDPIWREGEGNLNTLGYSLSTYRYIQHQVCDNHPNTCKFADRAGSGLDVRSDNYAAVEVANGTRLHPNVAGHRLMANWIEAKAAEFGFF